MHKIAESRAQFGGSWTIEKLEILESYLDAYTTVLKNKPFKLLYIDAFAGSGKLELRGRDNQDAITFLSGSAERALDIDNRPFDKLIFVDKDTDLCQQLSLLRARYPTRDIRVENRETNRFLRGYEGDWKNWRGILFLDPFATEVEWSTIEAIAGWEALDTWILFPVSAIARMLPRSRTPDDISEKWVNRLNRIFGDESWRQLYQPSQQIALFGGSRHERTPGVDGIVFTYKQKLTKLFGERFLTESRTLKTSTNSPLFEFMFCVGNPRGIKPAKRIAKHIVERL